MKKELDYIKANYAPAVAMRHPEIGSAICFYLAGMR